MRLLDSPPRPPVPEKEMGFHTTIKPRPGSQILMADPERPLRAIPVIALTSFFALFVLFVANP
ncbi:MAG TPA: hypothetical protein VGD97_10645 [Lacunisphaera sp.]